MAHIAGTAAAGKNHHIRDGDTVQDIGAMMVTDTNGMADIGTNKVN